MKLVNFYSLASLENKAPVVQLSLDEFFIKAWISGHTVIILNMYCVIINPPETLVALDEKQLCLKEALLQLMTFFHLCKNIILYYASEG